MFTLDLDKLTPEQRSMVALWEAHQKAEFQDKDAHASCDTMVANPYVNHVPVMTGGIGFEVGDDVQPGVCPGYLHDLYPPLRVSHTGNRGSVEEASADRRDRRRAPTGPRPGARR